MVDTAPRLFQEPPRLLVCHLFGLTYKCGAVLGEGTRLSEEELLQRRAKADDGEGAGGVYLG